MTLTCWEDNVTIAANRLRDWFIRARPTADEALSQVDEARARGQITREEYLVLLDTWPEDADGGG